MINDSRHDFRTNHHLGWWRGRDLDSSEVSSSVDSSTIRGVLRPPRRCLCGFTLVELLVVTLVLATVGVIAIAILVSSLRGSAKTATVLEARQNGNYVLSLMGRMIRNASATDLTTCSQDQITITNPDSRKTTFSCDRLSNNIASVSADIFAPTPTSVKYTLFPQSISVVNCEIACDTAKIPPTVIIKFSVSSSQESSGVTIPFQTAINLRNY